MSKIDLDVAKLLGFRLVEDDRALGGAVVAAKISEKVGNKSRSPAVLEAKVSTKVIKVGNESILPGLLGPKEGKSPG